jgi:hypothetical protein
MMKLQFKLFLKCIESAKVSVVALLLPIASEGACLAIGETEDRAKQAKQLVQEALRSEASGASAGRNELLIQAKEIAPDEPTVRWQQGQIQSGREWRSYPALVTQAKNSKALEDYRSLRDKSKPTLESQLELIQYCKKHGLKDQATAHWSAIAELAPENIEAKSQLGFEKLDGRWVQRRELELEREKAKRVAVILQKKGPDLHQLASDLASSKIEEPQAIDQLSKDLNVDSIPVWELCLSSAHKQGAAVVVGALIQSNAPESTKSLARHAIWVTDPGVRSTATKSLQNRDPHAYVPAMISELQGPWIANRQWMFDGNNRLFCRYSTISDGKDSQTLRVLDDTYFLTGNVSAASTTAAFASAMSQNQREILRKNANAAIEARNEQIVSALQEITGETDLKSPQDWWEWWDDKNEVYSTSEKPIETSYAYNNVSIAGRVPEPRTEGYVRPTIVRRSEVRRKECLAGGTPILTQRGPIAIERIRIGDLVLAKHFDTGEVRFQPVLRTTTRAPEPLIRITLAENADGKNQVIRASGGHPFWVSGKGWVRARELTAGSRLHGLERFTDVKEVEVEEKATKTYNLVVSEFHSYFVGSEAILSHDNSIVKPIQSVVPGLNVN